MTEQEGLRKIQRALISVSDKTGIAEFAQALKDFNVEIISTGGTAKHLRDAGIEIRDVSDLTGFPEMMDGRVKTLHPRVHGGLLGLRDNPTHQAAMREHGIEVIDLIVVNLYPFEETVARPDVTLEEAIEQIDIGGPAMIRSAAKNFRDVAVVIHPNYYPTVAQEMNQTKGALSLETRRVLAKSAFAITGFYDLSIHNYLCKPPPHSLTAPTVSLSLRKLRDLRYGENPHQAAALYGLQGEEGGIAEAELLGGKEMSFNNYVDADAAWQLVCEFEKPSCAIIKHTNPAGVASASSLETAYLGALACDPVSAFGGIVAFNRPLDEAAARALIEIFLEVVIAPDYEPAALEVLTARKNLRILRAEVPDAGSRFEYRQISGGMLRQTRDTHQLTRADLKVVSKRQPTEEEVSALLFAWTVAKHTKSNAIVYAREGQTVGVGAGQMSRVDSVRLGAMRAQLPTRGSVLASDAFFPFRDGIDEAAKHGITAVIQPGGSVKDSEVIAAADENGLAMVFTGVRHFRH
jgi:phosphoribosylaminoimidazolecarboxamide formyltransferase / IMP cyclohydrolase